MGKVLIIGAGGVATVAAVKVAKNADVFSEIMIASRTKSKCDAIAQYMKEQGIGYGSVNHPVDRDPVCGYTGVIDDVCPRCGRRAGESVSIEKLNELRKKYPDVPIYH